DRSRGSRWVSKHAREPGAPTGARTSAAAPKRAAAGAAPPRAGAQGARGPPHAGRGREEHRRSRPRAPRSQEWPAGHEVREGQRGAGALDAEEIDHGLVHVLHVSAAAGVGSDRRPLRGVERAGTRDEPAGDAELFVEERVVVIEPAVLAELFAVVR